MIPVKICGITSAKDAQLAIEKGASAIGVIFYDPSPRNVSIEIAKKIADYVNDSVPIIGVFVDEDIQIMKSILSQVNIDILQLHGSESPQYCEKFNLPIIEFKNITPFAFFKNLIFLIQNRKTSCTPCKKSSLSWP